MKIVFGKNVFANKCKAQSWNQRERLQINRTPTTNETDWDYQAICSITKSEVIQDCFKVLQNQIFLLPV